MKNFAFSLLCCSLMPGCQGTPPDPPQPVFGPSNPKTSPVEGTTYHASVIELIPEKEKLYRELHAEVWPEVCTAIEKANIRDYRIYRAEMHGKLYLFATFAYIGNDFEADMATIADDPSTRDKWWPLTDPCQIRIPGTPKGDQWLSMEQLMHLP
jgi:L-rhamnose mutarotase|tara:strand:- start:260 stop:721 length:462 start_codon:yes stop_codon:yes gene_type:complete